MATSFSMYSGDSQTLNIEIMDQDGVPYDVSGAQAIRYGIFSRTDESAVIKDLLDGVEVDGAMVTVTLLPEDTAHLPGGRYTHELEIIDADGDTSTVLQDTIVIQRDYLTA
jgi:hypothetical protein